VGSSSLLSKLRAHRATSCSLIGAGGNRCSAFPDRVGQSSALQFNGGFTFVMVAPSLTMTNAVTPFPVGWPGWCSILHGQHASLKAQTDAPMIGLSMTIKVISAAVFPMVRIPLLPSSSRTTQLLTRFSVRCYRSHLTLSRIAQKFTVITPENRRAGSRRPAKVSPGIRVRASLTNWKR
jgi:hypothetical protein